MSRVIGPATETPLSNRARARVHPGVCRWNPVFETEKFAGSFVQVGDPAFRIGDDDSFLDRVENGLEKTFFLGEAQKIILHFTRIDLPEATDQFFNESRFHRDVK